jgi:hypothetical protein
MSTFRNPVGPQPSRVYWRRRLVALLALVVVVVIAIAVISSIASGASKGATPTGPSSAAAPDAAAAPTSTPVAGAPCAPAVLKIAAVTDKATYAAGENPALSFTITNTGTVACTVDVGTAQQTFVVSSGEEQYWSSKDCEVGAEAAELTLEPNAPMASEATVWDRTRSSTTTCDSTRQAVPADGATFSLSVTVGAVKSATPKAFLLN